MRVVSIVLESVEKGGTFDCRGRDKGICDGCKLRFKCLTEQQEVKISEAEVKKHKLTNLRNLVHYMFDEGKIPYEITEIDREFGKRLMMKVKNDR